MLKPKPEVNLLQKPVSTIFNSFPNTVALLCGLLICTASTSVSAQTKSAKVEVPDWALPGSDTHKQVPPPLDFHRPDRTEKIKTGLFDGQSDVGAALVPGSSTFDKTTGAYTVVSAGYNIWYTRDEFRFLWKKMSGNVSLAADVTFPDTVGYGDRKVVVIIRQSLDDDAKEAMVGLHATGLLHMAWRPERNENLKEMKVDVLSLVGENIPRDKSLPHAKRIGIEKKGDEFTVYVSMTGEPMHPYGNPVKLKLDGPFYVGIGFCSHQPDVTATGQVSDVVLKNDAGKVK